MLNLMLHATTMNRDGDPARLDEEVAFGEFDAGAPRTGDADERATSTATDGGDSGGTEPRPDGGSGWR
jgi:glycerol-3-phosphate dehydrogenase